MIKDSKWNKTLEFMYMLDKSHPLTAIRALEVTEWSNSDTFKKIIDGTITDDDIEDDENTNNDGSETVEEEIGEKKKMFEFPKRKKKESNSIEDIATDEKPFSAANELRDFKALLDDGIITQEEFDAKKKEILNL
ncbi:MAG: SHOCT domain-containing protein [Eubacterium sp.]|nr:SHOCT domain-containing protein [Eubacterium sp.]